MRIRRAFVTNSSSSSFVIAKRYLTPEQVQMILDHAEIGEQFKRPCRDEDEWQTEVTEHTIKGSTWMDNFDMYEFMELIGIDPDLAEWRD